LTKPSTFENLRIFGDRLAVGQLVLVQSTGVRFPVPEPHSKTRLRLFFGSYPIFHSLHFHSVVSFEIYFCFAKEIHIKVIIIYFNSDLQSELFQYIGSIASVRALNRSFTFSYEKEYTYNNDILFTIPDLIRNLYHYILNKSLIIYICISNTVTQSVSEESLMCLVIKN
jgi:hypothetical protein